MVFYKNLVDIADFSYTEWNEIREVIMSVSGLRAVMVQELLDSKASSSIQNTLAGEVVNIIKNSEMNFEG